ncbi:uncharacterized protein LOC111254430 isoform X2 [Varroa destructor]|uniref:KASH domain-containing protein n=1 Tax=Varroa destructor TaxID=109461 RepID=A0A7M7KRS6_VARDE|nr:uncharacterized protein LOC111254430 isoform X2 [Varroa destructor]
MWDDYQDHYSEHYLDHYSEKEMDDDTVRRLLNFGDDYRSFIGSTSDTSSLSGLRVRGGGHKKGHTDDRRYRGAGRDSELDSEQEQMQQLNSLGHDESNSNNISCDNKMDIDAVTAVSRDHTHAHTVPALLTSSGQIGLDVGLKNLENSTQVAEVLNRSDRDLAFVTNALNKDLLSKDAMTANQFNEMIAKCRSNIQCLQIIKINISIGPDQPSSCSLSGNTTISGVYGPGNLAPSTEQLIRQLMERWNMLLLDIQSRGATNPNEESRSPVLANGAGANNVSNQCAPLICTPFRRTFDDESVREDIVKLREEMLQMECMQRELEDESVNLQRLNVNKLDERIAVLKDVRDLYNTWDTLYESTKHQLMNLQQSKNFLQDPNRRNNYLSEAFHRQKVTAEAELDGHHQVTDTSENAIDISEIIKISTQMKDSMGGATVADLPLTSLQPRNGICPASATLLQFKVNDDDYDSNYESEDDSPTICSDSEGNKSIWRIFKAALPFQVALVMLYCVACFMEPRCCDVTNTLNSFGPQLRYEQGPPPV